MPAPPTAWKALAALLQDRRVEIDPRYKNLALFATERGINYRLAWDLENGRRTNYRDATLLAVDQAYGWVQQSARRFVDLGVRPTTAAGTPEPREDDRPTLVLEHWDDTNVQAMWLLAVHPDQKLSLIETYLEQADAAQRGA